MKHLQIIASVCCLSMFLGCSNQNKEAPYWEKKHDLPQLRQIQNRLQVLLDKYELKPRLLEDTTDVYAVLDTHKAKYPGKVKVSSLNNTLRDRQKNPDWREDYLCVVYISDEIELVMTRKMWGLLIFHAGLTDKEFGTPEGWFFTSSGWSIYKMGADRAVWRDQDYYVVSGKDEKTRGLDKWALNRKGRKYVRQFMRAYRQRRLPK